MKKKILIVSVNWIGDVLFSTPFIKTLRDAFPDSHIACLLHPRCREVVETNKHLNEIIYYDEEGSHRGIVGKVRLIAQLRHKKFDTAFVLHQSFTKALITYLAGIRERVGYATKNRGIILTKAVAEPKPGKHKVEYFLDLARAYGVSSNEIAYQFFIDQADRESVAQFMKKEGLNDGSAYAVLCPGGNWGPKRWQKESFARLADAIISKYGVKIVLSGSIKDVSLVEAIQDMMKAPPIVSCGKFSLRQTAALFEKAMFVVANDSGPMHLAVAMGARVVALFGPTSPQLTGPYGKGRYLIIAKNNECKIPCYDSSCRENRCMTAIEVTDVLEGIDKVIKNETR